MTKNFKFSKRLDLPGYPFAELERKAAAAKSAGRELCDLSIGDPDLNPPDFVIEAIQRGLTEPRAHLYPSSRGDREVRRSVSRWYKGRFNVELDPDEQVCILIGAKEGLGQIARAIVNAGDVVSVPDPGYPVYWRAGCKLLDGRLNRLVLEPERSFLPDLEESLGSRLLYLNYPNNPTGAAAPREFLEKAADLAESESDMTIVYDMAYSEMCFDEPARSLLEFTSSAVEPVSYTHLTLPTN